MNASRWVVTLVLIAAGVRLGCVLLVPYAPSADFRVYHETGLRMADTWTLSCEAAAGKPLYRCFFPPGQVFTLGVIYSLFAPSVSSAQILNVIYGVLTVIGIWYLGRKFFSPRAARSGSLLAALIPSGVFGCVLIGAEVPATFWLILGLCIYAGGVERRGSRIAAIACGVCLGIGSLIRPTLVLAGIPIALHMVLSYRQRSRPVVCGAAIALGVAVVVLPWTYRNHKVTGGFVLLSSNGGGNLYSANNDEARGAYTESAWVHLFENCDDDLSLQRMGMGMALDWIAANPGRFVALSVRKFTLFWRTDKDIAWWATVQPRMEHPELPPAPIPGHIAQGISCGFYVGCFAVSLLGLWSQRKRLISTRGWLIVLPIFLYFTLVHMVFEAQDKYHFVLTPLVCMMAGVAAGIGKDPKRPPRATTIEPRMQGPVR
jgi:4-amino-4-deoxy-L-arabinose transferase-like glycosyltransferase